MASHIRRRKFLATLCGAAATWPLAALAQQPKVPTIGALVIGNISPEQFWREFRQGLRDLGYVEGQNIRFEFRSAEDISTGFPSWPPSWSVSKTI
jgi:putative ABC transport system substrate-binding protein